MTDTAVEPQRKPCGQLCGIWVICICYSFLFAFSLILFCCRRLLIWITVFDDIAIEKWSSVCNHSPNLLSPPLAPSFALSLSQVMETKNMLYLVTEYAKNGEIFGE